jgi:putative hydrolase of the HAD superfamily
VFDLDDTLHNARKHIFPFIHQSMNDYICTHLHLEENAAGDLRRHYWLKYGATLNGLIRHHGTNPVDFLRATHQLPDARKMIVRPAGVREIFRRLPGRKVIFSNSPRDYAEVVLNHLGLRAHIDAVYTIEDTAYRGKPDQRSYRGLLSDLRLNPARCIMVEDALENLRTAKRLGMKTIWISKEQKSPAFVDARISSLDRINFIHRLKCL